MSAGKSQVLRFAGLWTRQGWMEPAYVTLDSEGCVAQIEDSEPVDVDTGAHAIDRIDGYAMPGFQNAHSHAFQYAMAGMAEHLAVGSATDDFWSWRESMYKLALKLNPEQFERIAAMLYAEMLRHGLTAVAEFHYLHHDVSGKPYAQIAEMGERLIAAAHTAGIHITLIPILYQRGGFNRPASPEQRRFLSPNLDDYDRLVDATRALVRGQRDATVGLGIHSLRAVDAANVRALLGRDAVSGPIHIHVAEQRREVEECLAHLGARPVAWLLDHAPVDARFNLVHATHMDEDECQRLASSGAVAVICPATEGNLGDGFFPLARYHRAGGRFAIGTDSHISLSPMEDLRWLDYGQRLRSERRNVLCRKGGEDSGVILAEKAWVGGRSAMGLTAGAAFDVGEPFDVAVVDRYHPLVYGKPSARRLAAVVYGGDATVFLGVMRRGAWLVKGGRHVRHDTITSAFKKTLDDGLH